MDFFSLEFEYFAIGLNAKQVESWNIPTRQPKKKSSNDKLWPYSFAVELDAILITKLCNHLKKRLEEHLPHEERKCLLDQDTTQKARLRRALYDL